MSRPSSGRSVVLVDQAMSSVSNILAVILVARSLSADAFGGFALAFAVLTAILTLSRAYFGTRVSLVDRAADGPALTRALAGALVILAPLLVLVVLGASLLSTRGGSVGVIVVVALATPVVCVQDIARFGASASDHAWAALVSDTLWVAIMLVPFVVGADLSAAAALTLWGVAAVAAMVTALAMLHAWPDLRTGWGALTSRHAVGESLTYAQAISALAVLWVVFAASHFIGPAAAGSLRGAATAMGPINVLIAFSALGLTPALVRRPRSHDVGFCTATAGALAAVTLAWGAVLLVLPASVGHALLGESWPGIHAILPWTTGEYVALTVAAAAILGLKVRHRARDLVVQRAAAGVVTVVAGTLAAALTHETWAVSAMLVVAGTTSAVLGWHRFRHEVRHPSAPPSRREPAADGSPA